MQIKGHKPSLRLTMALWIAGSFLLAGCSAGGPVPGLIYTRLKYPLTRDLNNTSVPQTIPRHAKIIEISEPLTGLSISAKLKSNAIAEIAKANGMKTLYFADQERFSILGIWTYHKVILYGEKESAGNKNSVDKYIEKAAESI